MGVADENPNDNSNPDKEEHQSGGNHSPDADADLERIRRRSQQRKRLALRMLRNAGKKIVEHEIRDQIDALPDDFVEDKQGFLEWFMEFVGGLS